MTPRILLVEDDQALGAQVRQSLTDAGCEVIWHTRADTVMDAPPTTFDGLALVILDLMLPGGHGLDVLKHLRAHSHPVPVLILSARGETTDKVRALELGADDYLTKPFWPEELLARVRARLRRPALARMPGAIEVGSLVIDADGRTATLGGLAIDLTRVEFEILLALARRSGSAISRASLVDQVLDPDRDGDERTLDVHVSRLRKKLGPAGALIATVWGVGYRLQEPQP